MNEDQRNYLDKNCYLLLQHINYNALLIESLAEILTDWDIQKVELANTHMEKIVEILYIAKRRNNGYNALIKALEISQPESKGLKILREGPWFKEIVDPKLKHLAPRSEECLDEDEKEAKMKSENLFVDVKYPTNVENIGFIRDDEFYPLPSQSCKGVCLILNNKDCDRRGAKQDASDLAQLLPNLGFKIVQHTKSYSRLLSTPETLANILDTVKNQLNDIPEKNRSLATYIGCYDDICKLETADGERKNFLRDIIYAFDHKNCAGLIGRPKMFFINACRVLVDNDYTRIREKREKDVDGKPMTDTIICWNATPENWDLSGLNNDGVETIGSQFVYALCKVFKESARKSDLDSTIGKMPDTMHKLGMWKEHVPTQWIKFDIKRGFYFALPPVTENNVLHRVASSKSGECLKILKLLISNGANVYALDDQKRSFLHILSKNDSILNSDNLHDFAHFLIKSGYSNLFNCKGWENGATPIQWIIGRLEPDEKTLLMLGSNGVDFKYVNEFGSSVLTFALMGGRSLTCLLSLVNLGADLKHKDNNKASLLHLACELGNIEALKVFLDLGLDINAVDKSGCTPLHRALQFNLEKICDLTKFLVKNGADVTAKNFKGLTPLGIIIKRDVEYDLKFNVAKLLGVKFGNLCSSEAGKTLEEKMIDLKPEQNLQSFQSTEEKPSFETVFNMLKFFIENGGDFYVKDKNNLTILHRIVLSGLCSPSQFHEIAKYIIENGKSYLFNVPGGLKESTPLHLALEQLELYEETIDLLHSAGVDFNKVDSDGKSLLAYAVVGKRNIKCVERLIKLGVDPQYFNKNVEGFDNFSTNQVTAEVAQKLSEFDFKWKDTEGNSLLHLAVNGYDRTACVSVLKLLIVNGVDVSSTNKENNTFLHLLLKESPPPTPKQFHDITTCLVDTNKRYLEIFHVNGSVDGVACSPLHLSAERVTPEINFETLQLLADNKVDFNHRDVLGNSVLTYAIRGGKRIEFLEELIRLGANWEIPNNNGDSVLHIATQAGHMGAIIYFVKLGADIHATNAKMETVLNVTISK